MSWVMLSLRKMQLTQRVSNFEAKLLEISQRIMDLQNYGSNMSDGVITYNEAANCPSSMFGTQMNFMSTSAPIAYQSAQVKTNAYLQQAQQLQMQTGNQYGYAQGTTDPTYANSQQAYLLFNQIYKQELEEYSKQVTKQLDKEERELTQEKLRIETQLKAAEAELQSTSESTDQKIKDGAIKLA